jgi:hypothetical protein
MNKKKQLLQAFEEFKFKVGEIMGTERINLNIHAVPIEFFDKPRVLKDGDRTFLTENPDERLCIYSNDIVEKELIS